MAIQIQYERLIQGLAPPQVFGAVQQWLQAEGANVKAAYPPHRIEATHGKTMQMFGWREDAKKTLIFELAPAANGTAVRVTAIPPAMNAADVQMRLEVTRENWARVLERLWVRFGQADVTHPAVRQPQTDWNRALRESKRMMLISPLAGFAGLLGILAMSAIAGAPRGGFLYSIPPMIAVMAFSMGYWRWRDAKRGMARGGR